MPDPKPMVDITNLSVDQLKNLKSEVLKRVIEGANVKREVTSNLDVSHNRHSSVHSKG